MVIGMRYRLAHAYFAVNLDIEWHTVGTDLSAVLAELEAAIPEDFSAPQRGAA